MKKKYLYNGEYYTESEMNDFAKQSGVSFDNYIAALGKDVKVLDAPFEFKGNFYTQDEISAAAKKKGISDDTYLSQYGIKKKEDANIGGGISSAASKIGGQVGNFVGQSEKDNALSLIQSINAGITKGIEKGKQQFPNEIRATPEEEAALRDAQRRTGQADGLFTQQGAEQFNLLATDPLRAILDPEREKLQTAYNNRRLQGVRQTSDNTIARNNIDPNKTVQKKDGKLIPNVSYNPEYQVKNQEQALENVASLVKNKFFKNGKEALEYAENQVKSGIDPTGNETFEFATERAGEYKQKEEAALNGKSIIQNAIEIQLQNDPLFKKQYETIINGTASDAEIADVARRFNIPLDKLKTQGSLPQEVVGELVHRFISDPDIKQIAEDNPEFKKDFDNFTGDKIYEVFPEYADVYIKNTLSRARELDGKNNWFANPIFDKSKYMDNLAEEVFKDRPILLKRVKDKFHNNWEHKIETTGIVDDLATGARGAMSGMWRSLKDVSGFGESYSDRIRNTLKEQYGHVETPHQNEFRKVVGEASNFMGMVLAMGATGSGLGNIGKGLGVMNPSVASKAVTLATFFDDELNHAASIYPENPTKAYLRASLSTAFFLVAGDAIPASKITGFKQNITQTLKSLETKALDKQAKMKLRDKILSVATETLQGTAKGTAEMTVMINGFKLLIDRALGLDESSINNEYSDANLLATAKSMLFGLPVPSMIHGFKGINRTRAAIYEMASNPEKYKSAILKRFGSDDHRIADIDFIADFKKYLDSMRVAENEKAKMVFNALHAKRLREQKSPDAFMKRNHEEEIRAIEQEQQDIMDGKDSDAGLTDSQKAIKTAYENGEINEMMEAQIKEALKDPAKADQFIKEIAEQATGAVAPELGNAKDGAIKFFGETLTDFAIGKSGKKGGGESVVFEYENEGEVPQKLKPLMVKDENGRITITMPKDEADALQKRIAEGLEPDMELMDGTLIKKADIKIKDVQDGRVKYKGEDWSKDVESTAKALDAKKADIEKRRQEDLDRPYNKKKQELSDITEIASYGETYGDALNNLIKKQEELNNALNKRQKEDTKDREVKQYTKEELEAQPEWKEIKRLDRLINSINDVYGSAYGFDAKTSDGVKEVEQELKELPNKRKTADSKINAKYDEELKSLEQQPTSTAQSESNPALRDVESTAKALEGIDTKGKVPLSLEYAETDKKAIAEAYHADRAAGKETELTKAVEELLGKPTEKPKTETTPTVSSEVVSGSALKDENGLNEDANKILGLHDNGVNFDLFDNNKLRQIAKDNGIDLPEGAKNADIIEALKKKQNVSKEQTQKAFEDLTEADIDKLSPSEKAKLYKENGITNEDGSEITEKDIQDNPLQYSYDFMASSNSGKWNSANSELESAVQGNKKQYSLYKLMAGEFDTFKEFVDFINSKNYGDKIEYTERMRRADETMTPEERKSAIDSYNKSAESKADDKAQKGKDVLKEHGFEDEKEYFPQEIIDRFPLKGVQKVIYDIIKNVADKLGIKVKFSSSRITEGFEGSNNPLNGEILISPHTLNNGRIGEVLVHEVVHALTTKIISRVNSGVETGLTSKQVAAVKGLNKLYNAVRNDNKLENKYPVKDIFEFIAHLTNDNFVKELESKDRNFLQKVVDFIADILGIGNANELAKKHLKDIISDGTFLEKEGVTVKSSDYGANKQGSKLSPKQQLLEKIRDNSKQLSEKYHSEKENDIKKIADKLFNSKAPTQYTEEATPQAGSVVGGEVAKDDKGVPVSEGTWYHGSPTEGLSGKDLKPNEKGLIFFTRDKGIAERYATNDYEGNTTSSNVFERKLEVKNIFDPEKNSNNAEIIDLLASKGNFENAGRNADFDALAKEALENGEWSVLETKEFIDGLKKLGYDAIYIDNRPYYSENAEGKRTFSRDIAVFDTKQHKAVEQSLKEATKAGSVGVGGDVEATAKTITEKLSKQQDNLIQSVYDKYEGEEASKKIEELFASKEYKDIEEQINQLNPGGADLSGFEKTLSERDAEDYSKYREIGYRLVAADKKNGYKPFKVTESEKKQYAELRKRFDSMFADYSKNVDAENAKTKLKAVEQSLKEQPQAGSVGVGGDNPALKEIGVEIKKDGTSEGFYQVYKDGKFVGLLGATSFEQARNKGQHFDEGLMSDILTRMGIEHSKAERNIQGENEFLTIRIKNSKAVEQSIKETPTQTGSVGVGGDENAWGSDKGLTENFYTTDVDGYAIKKPITNPSSVTIDGVDFHIAKVDGDWKVIEKKSGLEISTGKISNTKNAAIEDATIRLAQNGGAKNLPTLIDRAIQGFKDRNTKAVEQSLKETPPALRDVESTAKALEGKTEGLLSKPTDEVRIEDLKNKNFSTFIYNKESDVPEIFKDKITSKGTTNGKTEIRVTLPKSEADYYLNKDNPQAISEAYHKAKADGSNPELVAAVEDLLGKPKAVTPNVEDWSRDVESTDKALGEVEKNDKAKFNYLIGFEEPIVDKVGVKIPIDNISETNLYGQKLSEAVDNVNKGFYSKEVVSPTVYEENGKYIIVDGFHRVARAKANGEKNIKVDIVKPDSKKLSEAYHKAKADGSNPELVAAVEDLLGKQKESSPTPQTGKGEREVKQQIETFGVPKQDVEPVHNVITQVFDGLKKAGLTAAKTVGEWVGIGKGEAKPYTLKINGEEKTVKPVNAEVVNGFYSPLEKTINETKFDKLPAKQWIDKFAKGEEAKWTGLSDWLAQQQGSVSKADIQKYLKDNRIQVVEVVKGEDMPNYKLEIEPPTELGADRMDLLGDLGKAGNLDNPRFRDYLNKKYGKNGNKIYDWLVENATVEGTYSKDTKFSQYQLEGQKYNYKEILVTMPAKKTEVEKKINDFFTRMSKKYGENFVSKLTPEENRERVSLSMGLDVQPKNIPFKSSHFDEPNILVHLRMNTRTDADGKKVLFLEEVQSDWGQKGKKEGFKEDVLQKEKDDLTFAIKRTIEEQNKNEKGSYNYNRLEETANNLRKRLRDLHDKESKTPTAPFVTDTNAWTKLGLKVALKEAVKQGADKIAWSTGTQQFERWGSEEIHWNTVMKPKGFEIVVKDDAKRPIVRGSRIKSLSSNDGSQNQQAEVKRLAEKWNLKPEDLEVIPSKGQWTLAINEQTDAQAFQGNEEALRSNKLEESDISVGTKAELRDAIKRNLSRERNDAEIDKLTDRIWNRMQTEDSGTSLPRKEGMESFYGSPTEGNIQLKYNEKGQHLAPNGKPSNLSEENAKKVRTKEFKDWFGDWENDPQNASKVVDENGEPLVVYHGTNANFDKFDTKYTKGGAERVSKFTTNKEAAKEYGNNVIEVFLRIDDVERGTKFTSKKGLAKWFMGGKTFDKARLDLVYESKKSEDANGGVIKDVRSNDGKHEMDVYYTDSNDNIRFVSDIKTPNQNIGIVGNVAKSLFGKGSVKTNELTSAKWKEEDGRNIFEDADGKYIGDYSKLRNGDYRAVNMFGKELLTKSESEAKKFIDSSTDFQKSTQHSIDITPEIKASVERGQPLFKTEESKKEFGGFETRDGKPIGFTYDTEKVARERFDISKLKKIGSGSDRDVYDLGNGKVLKVAKTARGLTQNIYEGDYYLTSVVPEVTERGLNYVVAENTPRMKTSDVVEIFDWDGNVTGKTTAGEMLKELQKFSQRDMNNHDSKLQDTLAKYGLQDIMSYEVLWNDFVAQRNWGYKDGKAYHSDGGTFGGVDMIDSYKGKTNLSDPEFKKIYEESRRLKKQFGDTDKATMYSKDKGEIQAQYRIESGKNIIEAIKNFDGSKKAIVALTHEIMHPTVVSIIDGAKEGNEVGTKHTETIVNEFNKANPNNKVTVDELISGNDAFKDGTTSKQYRAVQEFIAEAWEKYHHEGAKGFSKAFQEVLDAITEVFRQVYKSLTGTTLTPELRKMFDELLGKENVSEVVKAPEISSKAKNKFSNLREKIKQKQSLKIVSDEAENRHANSKLTEADNPVQEPNVKALESEGENAKNAAQAENVIIKIDSIISAATDVGLRKVSDISTDEKRFQGRDKLNAEKVQEIAENWKDADQDPIHVWTDPKDGKTYVLSGHHRLAAAKQAGREKVKVIDRSKDFTEEQAIRFAKEEANANRTMETAIERANTLRQKRERGDTKDDINKFLDREGKNKNFVNNLSRLNPKGKTIEALRATEKSDDKVTQKEVEKIADWIGEARDRNKNLTDAHENELFDFLMDREGSKRITTKQDFLSKVNSLAGAMDFNANEPLNIARYKHKTEGEKLYDKEAETQKGKISDLQQRINEINDRIKNPNNPQYLNPDSKDYEEIKKNADNKLSELNTELQAESKALLDLYQQKGKFARQGTEQSSLFSTEKNETELPEDYYNDLRDIIKDLKDEHKGITLDEIKEIAKNELGEYYSEPDIEAAYKMTEPQPPKSAPEPPKSAPSRPDKSVLTNIVNAENTPPEVKKKLTAHGLKYDPESHDEALQIARAVIDSLGIDAAVTEARARNFGGAVNTFIQTEALNALYKKEAQAKTAQEKYEAAEKFAEVSIALDEWARGDAGRGISALATFYQKSPLGMVLKENKSRKEEFNQWAKGKEESWDEFLERLNKTPEFSDYVSEKVQTELREERKKERSKFFKKVDDTLDKWINDLESGNVAFSSVVPPKLIAEALKGVKAAFKVGESATKIIGDAIDYISDKIGDNWDKDTFRAKIEKALNLRAEKTSVDRYADSLKKQIEELQKQIDAGKRDEKERKNKKEYSEEEKELQEKLKAKKAELEALSPLKNTESYKLAELDKFREKLKGLSEAEKDEVVSKAYKKLLDNGALDHADLREIIAKATGRGNLTEKQAARLQELNETINASEIAKQKHLKERTEQTLKEYHKAIDMAAKAKRDLANEFDKKTDYLKVISSSIQGNTLGLLNVAVMNPLYNITTHLALRLPIGTVQSLFGLALGKAEMNTVFGKPMQAEFFGKGGRGFREAFKGLLTGMNKADYESKEIFSSQIRPNRSLRALLGKDNREAKMKLQEKLFHTFSVFPGATAETNFRLLNFGDKPMRYSASAATAAAFAKKYGIKFNTMDWKTFMEFPREIVKEMELAKGKSLKEAEQEAEYVVRSIEKEGERSTMQQDNFFSDMLEKVFSGGKHEGAKSLAKTLTISPFVKIPSNVLWLGYNLVHPQIALAQAAAHTIRSYGYRGKGEIAESKLQMREARYWMSVTMMGAALQAVMIPLIKAGIITAANDEDDSKKKRIADLTYQPQGMFNMTKFWAYLSGKNVNEVQGGFEIPLKYFGLPGALGNSLARDYKQLTPEQKENRRLLTDNLLELFDADDFKDIENGIFSSSSSLLQGLKGGDMTYYAGNMVNLFTNLIQPAAVSEFSRAAIPYRISGKFDSLGDKIKNDLSNRSALFRKLTGKYPKGKRNIWGEIIKKDDSYANRYFGFNNVTKDNFAQFIYEDAQKWDDEDFLPPTVSNSLGGKKLTAEQLDELEENIGLARKEFIRAYTNDIALIEELGKNYSDILGRDAKKAALQYLYQKGRKLGVDMFVSKHPEFENVVSEEEKQVEELLKNFKEINLISEDEINEKIKH